MTDQSKTRSQQHEIEIDAPIEAVWKALTDAEELTRWFVEKAEVTPGEGGKIWIAWDEVNQGTQRIDVWDPGKRLVLTSLPSDCSGLTPTEGLERPIMMEYTLESRGGHTVLRMVHSYIPASPDWDGYYDGTDYGWKNFFRGLRYYLEKQPGKHRSNIVIMWPLQTTREESWSKLTGPEGLCASGTLDPNKEGSRYSVTTSAGVHLQGEVAFTHPPKSLLLTVENLVGTLLSISIESMGGGTFLYVSIGLFGATQEEAAKTRESWTTWLRSILPPAPPAAGEQPA